MIKLNFQSRGVPEDTFQVTEFEGVEEISSLFRFEVKLVSRNPDIDFQSVLDESATLEIIAENNSGSDSRYIQGMLSEFEQGEMSVNGLYEYHAVLVPRLWMMTQSQQNQIAQLLAVPGIIENELLDFSHKGGHPLVVEGLSNSDYEFNLASSFEQREYVVQYKETDFNFISRLMEHEGIFYHFEHNDELEKVVFSDNQDMPQIIGNPNVYFKSDADQLLQANNVVFKLGHKRKQIPSTVFIKDYNYRNPSLPMEAEGVVEQAGIGFVSDFGGHFKTPEEGDVLAHIRAEEYLCRQNNYVGQSNVSTFCSGHTYTLKNHFREDRNQEYLLTKVVHKGSQVIQSWANVGGATYENEFECIPSEIQYRPARVTAKPKLYGVMNGVIDSEQDMGRADIDEEGRYKVLMPFDISGAAPGKASRRIRMSQPYGGGGAGMSFPLIKGTEVIWTCIDGDIDRPIITGTVANPLNPSVTTAENHTTNVIRTASGILMGFNDGSSSSSSGSEGVPSQQQSQKFSLNENIESDSSAKDLTQINQKMQLSATPKATNLNTELPIEPSDALIEQQNLLTLRDGWQVNGDIEESDGNWQLKVPYSGNVGYLRLGADCRDETITDVTIPSSSGWVDYTDGDRVSVTQGEKFEYINGGNYNLNIAAGAMMESDASLMWHDSFTNVGGGVWRRCTFDWTSATHLSLGDAEELVIGAKFDGFVGLATGVTIGGSLNASFAADVAVKGGFDFTFGSTLSNDKQDKRLEVSSNKHEMSAGKRVKVNVKPASGVKAAVDNKGAVASVAALNAIVATGLAAGPLIANGGSNSEMGARAANSVALGVGYGSATAIHAGLTAKALADIAAHSVELGGEAVELDMSGTAPNVGKIRLGVGAGVTTPVMPGIDITPSKITIGFGPTSQIQIKPTGITITSQEVDVKSINAFKLVSKKVGINGAESITLSSLKDFKIEASSVDSVGFLKSSYT